MRGSRGEARTCTTTPPSRWWTRSLASTRRYACHTAAEPAFRTFSWACCSTCVQQLLRHSRSADDGLLCSDKSLWTPTLEACGCEPQIEHLDGHKVKLEAGGVTRPGQVVVIKGEGMPVYDSVGALHVSVGSLTAASDVQLLRSWHLPWRMPPAKWHPSCMGLMGLSVGCGDG